MDPYRNIGAAPAGGITLKSFEFRRAREATWTELEELIDRVDKRGLRGLSAEELTRLPLLYRATQLQTTFGAHMLALEEGQPREFNLKQLLESFRDHRLEVIRRRSRFDLEQEHLRRHPGRRHLRGRHDRHQHRRQLRLAGL